MPKRGKKYRLSIETLKKARLAQALHRSEEDNARNADTDVAQNETDFRVAFSINDVLASRAAPSGSDEVPTTSRSQLESERNTTPKAVKLLTSVSSPTYFSPPVLVVKKSLLQSRRTYCKRNLYNDSFNSNSDSDTILDVSQSISGENVNQQILEGRRVMTMDAISKAMTYAAKHDRKCANPMIRMVKETKKGMRSLLTAECSECNYTFEVDTDSGNKSLQINEAAAWAANVTGIGFTGMEHSLTMLDVPFMARNTYNRYEQSYIKDLTESCNKQMLDNGQEEKAKAIELGQVDSDGVPWSGVFGDAQWSKRSFGHQGTALSGSAALIGVLTKKPLFIGVRNKFCLICKKGSGKPHKCFKNWEGSSSAMETDIILEGFSTSIEQHGLRYRKYIGDGDSSVFSAIKDVYHKDKTYFNDVEKIECKNHAIVCLVRNLRKLLQPILGHPPRERKLLEKRIGKIGKLCQYLVQTHIQNRPTTNSKTLKDDILAIPYHVFGNHAKCSKYLCLNGKTVIPAKYAKASALKDREDHSNKDSGILAASETTHDYDIVYKTKLWMAMENYFKKLGSQSLSLLYDMTTNLSESLNSQINKFSQGRRVNWIQRGSYNKIALQGALAFQGGSTAYVGLFQKAKNTEPSSLMVQRHLQAMKRKKRSKPRPRQRRGFTKSSQNLPKHFSRIRGTPGDAFYGPNARADDLPIDEVLQRMNEMIESKAVQSKEEQWNVHLETRGQYDNVKYIERKRCMITASIAGRVVSLRDSTSNVGILDMILQPPDLSKQPAVKWGKNNENKAIELYCTTRNVAVQPAGLFVSLEFGMLGASPDGLVGEDGIIEVKCPYAEREGLPTESASRASFPLTKVVDKTSKTLSYVLSRRSLYYSQVVMQLHITGRDWCDFIVWTQGPYIVDSQTNDRVPLEKEGHMHVTRIHRDAETQKKWDEMRNKLIKFFKEDLGPELVDSRWERNLGYRQPQYRTDAMQICAITTKKTVQVAKIGKQKDNKVVTDKNNRKNKQNE